MARDYEQELVNLKERYEKARQELYEAKAAAKKEEKRLAREQKKAANAAARRARVYDKRKQRRAAGLCKKCGKKAMPSKRRGNRWAQFCPRHHAAALKAQRIRRGVKQPYIVL